MTGIIQQMISVIQQTFDLDLGRSSVNVGRFITHVRYLFVRIHQNRQLDDTHSAIGLAIRNTYPEATACADRLAALIELRLGAPLTDDEIAYLALHVSRVADKDS
jgi:beta-glucoside operon transcriptional antiterminator